MAQERTVGRTPAGTAAPSAARPPTCVVRIFDDDLARALAEHLLTPGRRWPVALISTAAGHDEPYVDADALKREIGDLAEVAVLATGSPSWAFSEIMPHMTQVYGGASRVYSVDHEWIAEPRRSTLRFAYSAADGPGVAEKLTRDVLAAAVKAGLLDLSRPVESVSATGTVAGIVGDGERALVTLDDGGMASVRAEVAVPGLPLDQVLQVGQRVAGRLDPETRLLDLRSALEPVTGSAARNRFIAAHSDGDVVLAQVAAVTPDSVELQVLPGYAVRVGRELVTGNERDRLDDLFTPGEVVLARVVQGGPAATDGTGSADIAGRVAGTAGAGGVGLRLDDIDDDEDVPLRALALLDGGPPWLTRPTLDERPWEPAPPTTAPLEPSPAAPSAGSMAAAPLPAPRTVPHPAAFPVSPATPELPAASTPEAIPTPLDLRPGGHHPAPTAPATPSPAALPRPPASPAEPTNVPGSPSVSTRRAPTPRDIANGPVSSAPRASTEPQTVEPQPEASRPVAPPPAAPSPSGPPEATLEVKAKKRVATRDLSLTLAASQARARDLEQRLAQALESQLERDQLRDMLAEAEQDRVRAQHKAAMMTTKYREASTKLQRLRKTSQTEAGVAEPLPAGSFADPAEQFRAEVWLEWARILPAEQKAEHPLAPWRVGEGFLDSLDSVEGVSRSKVVRVVMEILTGLAPQLAGREVHMLRQGPGGDDPVRTREDGAVAYRASLQRHTPAARRIHYWMEPGGSIELIKIGTHDDLTT